jgi:hypothetical protein
LIAKAENDERAQCTSPPERAATGQTLGEKTCRQESIRCSKGNCKYARGKLHGPYWYTYAKVKGRLTSQYIGKSLPGDIQKKLKKAR